MDSAHICSAASVVDKEGQGVVGKAGYISSVCGCGPM
jgi:hypothetical protein